MATFGTKKLAVEFFATDGPNPSPLTQNSCLAHFWSFGTGTKNCAKSGRGAALDTFGTKKHAVEFFAMDAPNPSPMTQNSCLACFWMFGTGTKNCAKIGREGRY